MSMFRGPVALDEIQKTIGPFDRVIIASDSDAAVIVPMTNALGYAWICGCEARGNGSPLCQWRACGVHEFCTSTLPPRTVPRRYIGGVAVPRQRVRQLRTGDVVVSAKAEIEAARLVGSAIGYVEDGKVIREFADGRREVVASV